jgi:myo-inositol-1(or 4)-monophosphatase
MAGSDIPDYLAFAHQLADAARNEIAPYFRNVSTDNKFGPGGFDPVTAADRATERAMRDLIAAHYPTHRVYGEEEGGSLSDDIPTWVLDPIDGTRAFICGLPTWGTLIALDLGQGPVVGVLDQGFTAERFFAACDGAYLTRDGQTHRLAARKTVRLEDATLATTSPDLFTDPNEASVFNTLRDRVRMTRYGTDCYAYAMLAAGHIDLVVESGLKPYDIQALIPIIEQAGGVITTWDGGSPRKAGRIVAAATAELHQAACAVLAI